MNLAFVALWCSLLGGESLAGDSLGAESWPEFRGPTADGRVTATGLPTHWSETENIAWKTPLPGRGWSTPVYADGVLWMTTATGEGHRLWILAVDAVSGELVEEIFLREIEDPGPCNSLNSYASPSPVISEGRLYVHFGRNGTACLDTKTKKFVWKREDLIVDHVVGAGASPVLYADRLIFNHDAADQQYVIALDAATGETVWKTDRSLNLDRLHRNHRKSFATPLLVEIDGQAQVVCVGAQATMAYDPMTGDEQWVMRLKGYSQSSRPVADQDMVYVSTGYDHPIMAALRLTGNGEGWEFVWRYGHNVPKMSSPILTEDGNLVFMSEGGIFTSLDAQTGERIHRRRIGGEYSASPILAEGRIYFASRDGRCPVILSSHGYSSVADNRLEATFMASPIVVGRAIILRSTEAIYRVEQLEGKTAKR